MFHYRNLSTKENSNVVNEGQNSYEAHKRAITR